MFRYVLGSYVKEAFIGFSELSDRTANGVTDCICKKIINIGWGVVGTPHGEREDSILM